MHTWDCKDEPGAGRDMEHSSEGPGSALGSGQSHPPRACSQPLWEGCNERIPTLSPGDADFQGLPLGLGSGPRASSAPMCWAVPTVVPGHSRILLTHPCGIPSPPGWTACVTALSGREWGKMLGCHFQADGGKSVTSPDSLSPVSVLCLCLCVFVFLSLCLSQEQICGLRGRCEKPQKPPLSLFPSPVLLLRSFLRPCHPDQSSESGTSSKWGP